MKLNQLFVLLSIILAILSLAIVWAAPNLYVAIVFVSIGFVYFLLSGWHLSKHYEKDKYKLDDESYNHLISTIQEPIHEMHWSLKKLSKKDDGTRSRYQRDLLRSTKQSCANISHHAQTVGDLVLLLQGKEIPVHPQPCNPKAILHDFSHGKNLKAKIPNTIPNYFVTDPDRFIQILNILSQPYSNMIASVKGGHRLLICLKNEMPDEPYVSLANKIAVRIGGKIEQKGNSVYFSLPLHSEI